VSKVLSIDLAHTTVRNLGICLLEEAQGQVDACDYLQAAQMGLRDPPVADGVADAIFDFCMNEQIHLVMLDGPQGWKDPSNGLPHSRVCERILNTPAKTGTLGQVKPANYTQFVEFSIAIFASLVKRGASLASNPIIQLLPDRLLVIESFPLSAWRRLNIVPLRSKRKSTATDCENRLRELKTRFGTHLGQPSSHDELQALVAGLGGTAIAAQNHDRYIAEGVAPFHHEGTWVEGFIVNPKA